MPKLDRVRTAVIAGREYTLHFAISDRRELDKELGQQLWDAIVGGLYADQVTILRFALRKKYPSLTNSKLDKLLEQHVEQGGDYDVPVRQAIWAAIEAGLVGRLKDIDALRKALPDPDLDPPAEDEEEPGKGTPAAAVAKSGI